ncbi:MAG TPA: hypothetical protein VF852_12265, partial [Pseudolabrys sp.]
MTSSSFGRCIAGSALAAFLAAAPFQLAAQPMNALESGGLTASGSYLAARHAGQQRDAAAAAAYYRSALKRDPNNGELLDRAFLSFLVDGDVDEAVKFAERVAQADKNDRVARLVLGVSSLKRKQYTAARRDLAQSIRGPITDLTATLLSAWSTYGANDSKGGTGDSLDIYGVSGLDIGENRAYVSSPYWGLIVLDITDILAPQVISTYYPPGDLDLYGVAVSGGYIYFTCDWQGLRVIDLSNMQIVASIDTLFYATFIKIIGNYAYVVYGEPECPLAIIDISIPQSPQIT